jgi:hypothetical protein
MPKPTQARLCHQACIKLGSLWWKIHQVKSSLEFTLKSNGVIASSKYDHTLIGEQTIVAHLTKLWNREQIVVQGFNQINIKIWTICWDSNFTETNNGSTFIASKGNLLRRILNHIARHKHFSSLWTYDLGIHYRSAIWIHRRNKPTKQIRLVSRWDLSPGALVTRTLGTRTFLFINVPLV